MTKIARRAVLAGALSAQMLARNVLAKGGFPLTLIRMVVPFEASGTTYLLGSIVSQ